MSELEIENDRKRKIFEQRLTEWYAEAEGRDDIIPSEMNVIA